MTRSKLIIAAAVLLLSLSGPAEAQVKPSQDRGDSAGNSTLLVAPKTGEQVYRQVCQACHMKDGGGGVGAATIPALSNNPRLASSAYPIMMVGKGRGAMPGLTDLLAPAQIAEVSTYVRTHFGNSFTKPVTEDDVKKMQAALSR